MEPEVQATFIEMMKAFAAVENTLRIFAVEGEKDHAKIEDLNKRVSELERTKGGASS